MKRTATARVAIDGEREYKQALQELSTGSRTLGTEMKKLQAEYKGQEQSTEFLTKKGELLERQLLQQRDKVETLRQAVAKAAAAYGESDSRTQKWIQQLNLAEAAEADLRYEISQTTGSVEEQSESMTGLGDTVGDLTQKLGIKLPQGATNALNGVTSLSVGTVAAMGAAAAGVMALVKTVKQLQDATIEAAARADDILTKSTQMNISAQQYQALQYASPFVDVDVETMAGSLSKLTKAMADAQGGSEKMQAAFRDLGVEITNSDGSLRNSYDVWLDVMDALAAMGNETERDAAAMDLLGKSAQEFAPIYRNGTEALRDYTKAAEENYVMSDEQLEALARVDDAWQKLQLDIEANKNMLAVQWAPTAEKALVAFDKLVNAAGKALVDSGLLKGVGELVQFTAALVDPITDLLSKADGAPGRLKPVYTVLHGIAGVLAWIADAADVVAGLLTLDFTRIGNALGYGKSSGNYSHLQQWMGYGDTSGQVYDESTGLWTGNGALTGSVIDPKNVWTGEITGNIYDHNAGGTTNWRGGLTWVGEAGPELVALPAGSQISSAQDSRNAGGDTFYITIDAKSVKEFNDIVELAKSARVRQRMR